MNLKFMLDTNICIYVLNKRPESMMQYFNKHFNEICISSITLAELYYGAAASKKKTNNRKQVEDFARHLVVLDFDDHAASISGEVRASLKKLGTPIGAYDLLIASHALSQDLAVVTNNEKEFRRVKKLKVVNWVE